MDGRRENTLRHGDQVNPPLRDFKDFRTRFMEYDVLTRVLGCIYYGCIATLVTIVVGIASLAFYNLYIK